MTQTRVLTGITTSGTPHLGNYVGAIRPAVAASRDPGVESFYFLADLHALIKVQKPERVQRSTLEIAASWLACGLEPDKVWFYRQSEIVEIPELAWFLTCVAGKGILNRAHAYKAAVDKNRLDGEDDDASITAGLFMYPVLMAADILVFNAHKVPVGRDQIQHIEMARDFGQRFNHLYGEHFVLPEALIEESVATLPGLDGRKMSKSYDNTIPLFAPREELKKLIYSIVTDSRAPGEPKQTEGSALFQIYQAFASEEETEAMRRAFAEGIAWGEAKQALFERIDAEIAPLREKYEALMARPQDIEALLIDGARRVRERYGKANMQRLREAVGLRDLSDAGGLSLAEETRAAAVAAFKQYREADGRFYFKLAVGDEVLLQSRGFAAPKDIGQLIGRAKSEDSDALLDALLAASEPVAADARARVAQALQAIREAEEAARQAKAAAAQERAAS
ncbi:tryptophanyl-tRNA synthetase [Lysobacter enzymogenes]|uniref:Tryptophan--tRNA ligase n=1 Tax=Lysobacter enzymogenes TaxID=69 RepID=A0A0S2DLX6_LYSEN|nr:tryptophan--tRNA ligase [Lysobacter enzymogenes]ALN59670.1 tryptophanyl-tRNA synthetase [Lysobacter enzymogenes]QCW27781.1 tryptophan--tRNA ligase [Lysobacter enzymogenes]